MIKKSKCPKCQSKVRYDPKGPRLLMCGVCTNALTFNDSGDLSYVGDEYINELSTEKNGLRAHFMKLRIQKMERQFQLEINV